MTKFFQNGLKTILYTTITSKRHPESSILSGDMTRQSYSYFLTFFAKKVLTSAKMSDVISFFLFQNDLCMIMYSPAKFQVNLITFEDFMDGGMFCPPGLLLIEKARPR